MSSITGTPLAGCSLSFAAASLLGGGENASERECAGETEQSGRCQDGRRGLPAEVLDPQAERRRADKLTNAQPLYVTVPTSYRRDRRVFIDQEAIPIDVLGERMRQAMQSRNDKQVYLRGDGEVQLQELMDVFGRLKEAGVEKIGVVAQERRARQ